MDGEFINTSPCKEKLISWYTSFPCPVCSSAQIAVFLGQVASFFD